MNQSHSKTQYLRYILIIFGFFLCAACIFFAGFMTAYLSKKDSAAQVKNQVENFASQVVQNTIADFGSRMLVRGIKK